MTHKLRKRIQPVERDRPKVNFTIAFKMNELEGKELINFVTVDRKNEREKDILFSWCKHFAMKGLPYKVTEEPKGTLILWIERKA